MTYTRRICTDLGFLLNIQMGNREKVRKHQGYPGLCHPANRNTLVTCNLMFSLSVPFSSCSLDYPVQYREPLLPVHHPS